ncbi:hypothetical protein GCM10011586_25620 [Silvibacterium dinghuense]|nr:hypothetical protein GCM10011586_25620 [Silvibacterium dinghuense]
MTLLRVRRLADGAAGTRGAQKEGFLSAAAAVYSVCRYPSLEHVMAFDRRHLKEVQPGVRWMPSRAHLFGAIVLALGLALAGCAMIASSRRAMVPVHTYELAKGQEGEWHAIGGNWQFGDNIVESKHSDDRGAKLVTGSKLWANYTLTADLRFDSDRGDIGLILRSQDEENGIDAYNGYYVGLRLDGGTLIIGRSNFGWVEARPVPLPGGVSAHEWYRMRVTAYGCRIGAYVQNLSTLQKAYVAFEERNCAKTGRIGLRAVDVTGAWRNIHISPATLGDYLELQRNTESVERPVVLSGPPWWTPWHIAELFVGTLALALLLQLLYYRFQQWKSETIMQERQRLAHDIHDTMAQNFAGLGYHIQGIRSALLRGGMAEPQHLADQLSVTYQLIRRCHSEASETISMLGAGPASDREDLLKVLADSARKIAGQGILVVPHATGSPQPLSLRVADALQHIGKEAIANALTHSGLSQLDITVHYQPRRVEVLIEDNGRGFDYGPQSQGFGILGMLKRARDVRGTLQISSRIGKGTAVRVVVELHPLRWDRTLLSRLWSGGSASLSGSATA